MSLRSPARGMQVAGDVIGTPGGSLAHASWAANQRVADIGQRGEVRSAAVLNRLAQRPGGPTVLHDLRIPIPGFTANIDHIVIAGDRVTLIDSKVWRGGFYWTFRGRTRCGTAPAPHCDKKTLPTARRAIEHHLASRASTAPSFGPNVLAVWPTGSFMSWLYRPQEAVTVPGEHLARRLPRLTGVASANPVYVQALRLLVHEGE